MSGDSFPHSSVGKESACNAEDPGLIPGSGRSTGEGIGCPLQYSWASLVTQLTFQFVAERSDIPSEVQEQSVMQLSLLTKRVKTSLLG